MAELSGWVPALTLLAALGCGLMAGVFFAFSTFVMRALARLPAEQGIAAMQSINTAVLRSSFLAVFLGTAAVCAVVAVLVRDGYAIAGGVLYLVGTFGVTVGLNVPLNEELGRVDGAGGAGEEVWKRYTVVWTRWNHVRTAAALAATAALILALMRGRG
ncbi:MAG: DUF1772 domain-containing protein [Gemmatimonadetes bacterium]|nr:DUF1772 domain-containing protein [Gemmatimonadota bacterium]